MSPLKGCVDSTESIFLPHAPIGLYLSEPVSNAGTVVSAYVPLFPLYNVNWTESRSQFFFCLPNPAESPVRKHLLNTDWMGEWMVWINVCFSNWLLEGNVCWNDWLINELKWNYYLTFWASLVAQTVKNLPVMLETQVWSLGWEGPLEKGMTTHSSLLAWRIPWTEQPSGLQWDTMEWLTQVAQG